MTKEEKLAKWNESSPFNVHNNIVIEDFSEGKSVVTGELKTEALNPAGIAHGGFVYSLCDVAAGISARSLGHSRFTTLSSSIYFMHPSKGTRLRAEGEVVKNGRNVIVSDVSVYDDTGKMTAKGVFEVFVLE